LLERGEHQEKKGPQRHPHGNLFHPGDG